MFCYRLLAWPSPSPRLTENTVQLTLPPAVPGVNYQVVWELPDGTFRVLGTFGPGDSRQQSFPIAPGQTYRFGLRSFSTTTQQVSPVGTFITITVPQSEFLMSKSRAMCALPIVCGVTCMVIVRRG